MAARVDRRPCRRQRGALLVDVVLAVTLAVAVVLPLCLEWGTALRRGREHVADRRVQLECELLHCQLRRGGRAFLASHGVERDGAVVWVALPMGATAQLRWRAQGTIDECSVTVQRGERTAIRRWWIAGPGPFIDEQIIDGQGDDS